MRSITLSAVTAVTMLGTVSLAAAQQRQGAAEAGAQTQTMDMNTFMSRCAQLRQQVRPGAPQSVELRQTLDQCDQMDRSMGMTPPPRR